MTDWINRFDQVKNKVKAQLNAKGVDNINQLRGFFHVSETNLRSSTETVLAL